MDYDSWKLHNGETRDDEQFGRWVDENEKWLLAEFLIEWEEKRGEDEYTETDFLKWCRDWWEGI